MIDASTDSTLKKVHSEKQNSVLETTEVYTAEDIRFFTNLINQLSLWQLDLSQQETE